jgi:hypothetical protein
MNFIVKSLLKKQLKGVPDDQIDAILAAIEKNPTFFQELAEKVKTLTDSGMSQQEAAQKIMSEQGNELKGIFSK